MKIKDREIDKESMQKYMRNQLYVLTSLCFGSGVLYAIWSDSIWCVIRSNAPYIPAIIIIGIILTLTVILTIFQFKDMLGMIKQVKYETECDPLDQFRESQVYLQHVKTRIKRRVARLLKDIAEKDSNGTSSIPSTSAVWVTVDLDGSIRGFYYKPNYNYATNQFFPTYPEDLLYEPYGTIDLKKLNWHKTCNAGSTEELVFLMSEIIDCIIKGEIE